MAKTAAELGDLGLVETLDTGLTRGYLGPRVRILWNLLSSKMTAALEPFGLKTGAFSTMALIAANPGCSQNQLARALGMDKSAVVAIIDELESRGLANRVRGTHDRRRHSLSLTPEGEALMQRMYDPVSRVGLPIREALSKRELEQLMSLLDRAYNALAAAEGPDSATDAKL
jgi:DNA-binding MarR family transcriptional regulator